jgi:hypothetical protein
MLTTESTEHTENKATEFFGLHEAILVGEKPFGFHATFRVFSVFRGQY